MVLRELERVRDWADKTMTEDKLPGWAWYEVAKLRSDLDSVLNRGTADVP